MNGRFAWYQLATTDTAAATAFYGPLLGWTARDAGMPDFTYLLLAAQGQDVGGLMQLMPEQASMGVPPHWMGFIEVADVDATAAQAADLGGTILSEPRDIPAVGRFAVIADPQGAVVAVMRWLEGGSPPAAPAGAMGPVGWHELMALDWEAVFPFYAKLFGWTKGEAMDMGGMGTYQLFDLDGVSIGGMFNKPPEAPMAYWLFYAQVPDIQAAVSYITGNGGTVVVEPMEVPGGGWIVQASDPQGAMFAVVAPPSGATGCGTAA
ncbi:VOC family protein [Xanthobacteraceae bacterium A53D]